MIPENVEDLEVLYRESLSRFCYVPGRKTFERLAAKGGISPAKFDRWADSKQWWVGHEYQPEE